LGDLPFQFDVAPSEFGGAFADALFQGPVACGAVPRLFTLVTSMPIQ